MRQWCREESPTKADRCELEEAFDSVILPLGDVHSSIDGGLLPTEPDAIRIYVKFRKRGKIKDAFQ